MVTDDPEDCIITTTTSSPAGCCHGDLTSFKANEKCVGLEDQNSCERKSCSWLITDEPEDCVVTTTTSEPWLGAKGESQYTLPVNPYARSSKQRRAEDHRQESVLFGQGAIAETMQSTVSLSPVLMMV